MSEIRATTISDAAGTGPITLTGQSAAKVWAKYGMDDNTINDSLNLSSLTDNGTGDFTNTWTNAFDSINYLHLANGSIGTGGSSINKMDFYTPSATQVRLFAAYHNGSTENGSGTAYDYELLSLLCHGDLA